MLKEERQQRILETLRDHGKVVAADLSSSLMVSEDTIRRDLRELASAKQLQRVHGGALPHAPFSPSYARRQHEATESKVAIARAAAQLIQNGQIVLMDGGTTTLQVALHLPPDLQATIITNSLPLAEALAKHPGVSAIMLGGQVLKESLVTVGAATLEAINTFRADLCFLGVCSLHPEIGISTPDFEEVHIKRAMVANAGEAIALVSAEKLGTAAPYVVAPVSALTHVVTDHPGPGEALEPYRQRGVTVITAQ